MTSEHAMTGMERRAAFSLASIYAVRMFGLFMILPVIALYANQLQGSTPLLIGIAIGIYGLTQALLQIPLGALSDRLGRKPIIVGGLLIFALGGLVAAESTTMWGVIAGRAIQGAGAIAAVVMALAADLTRESQRTKVMASIGMSIGLSFALALVIGPVLNGWIGVPGMFWLTTVLALLAIALVLWVVPKQPEAPVMQYQSMRARIVEALRPPELRRMYLGIFLLHLSLTANFVVIPLILRDQLALASADHWLIYLPVLLLSFALSIPVLLMAERKGRTRMAIIAAIALLVVSEAMLVPGSTHRVGLFVVLMLYFSSFNLLEASLPSLLSKTASQQMRGAAMGMFSACQFLGAFFGGVFGGLLFGLVGADAVFFGSAALLVVWLGAAMSMRDPQARDYAVCSS